MVRQVARLHLNPGGKEDGLTKDDVFEFCRTNGILGVGWALNRDTGTKPTWSEYVQDQGKPNSSVKQLYSLSDGDLVWVKRDVESYFLAEVVGPWEYRSEPEYRRMDVRNVRPATFKQVPIARVTDEIAGTLRQRPTCRFVRNPHIVRDTFDVWQEL